PSVIPFGVTTVPLRPLFNTGAFIGEGVPTFEIRDFQNSGDLIIKTPHLGHALATTLGAKPAALMRGHGAVVVGESLMLAVVRSVYLELSAKLQMQAMLIAGPGGQVVYLDEREVSATSSRQVSAGTWRRTWDLWCIKARAQIEMEQKAKRRQSPSPGGGGSDRRRRSGVGGQRFSTCCSEYVALSSPHPACFASDPPPSGEGEEADARLAQLNNEVHDVIAVASRSCPLGHSRGALRQARQSGHGAGLEQAHAIVVAVAAQDPGAGALAIRA